MAKEKDQLNIQRNLMQGLFRNNDDCYKFYYIAFPEYDDYTEEHYYRIEDEDRLNDTMIARPLGKRWICRKKFETKGIDIAFSVQIEDLESNHLEKYSSFKHLYFYSPEIRIKVVPFVSDDYPKVLELMHKKNYNCLFLKEYKGSESTKEIFLEIFKQSKIRIVFESDLKIHDGIFL